MQTSSNQPPIDRLRIATQAPEPYMVVSVAMLGDGPPLRLHAVDAVSKEDAIEKVATTQPLMVVGALTITDWMARGAAVAVDNPRVSQELRAPNVRRVLYEESGHLLDECRSLAEIIRSTFPDQHQTMLRGLLAIEGRLAHATARTA